MLNFGRYHQNAYVTNDYDRALGVFAKHYGVSEFYELQLPPGMDNQLPLRVGLANAGGVEIELIHPLDAVPMYDEFLPQDGSFAIEFHHYCMLIEGDLTAWEDRRKAIDEIEHPIANEGGLDNLLRYMYMDERSRLGHYIEHVWYSPEMFRQMEAAIPRF